jgi:hypothetical protein
MMRASEMIHIAGDPNSPVLRAAIVTGAAIDAVHRFPRSTRLVVRESRARRTTGVFISTRTSAEIVMSRKCSDPHFAFAHEFGHFIDDRIIQPYIGIFASGYDEDFQPLFEAWNASPEVIHLQRLLRRNRPALPIASRRVLAEMLWPEELFARAYAQWLAYKTGHHGLLEELARRLANPGIICGIRCRFEWEPESFKTIMQSVDRLFKKKGIL